MSAPLFFACLWVFARTLVAMLPMRYQYPSGLALLIAAPLLLVWIGVEHGPWIAIAGVMGFISMFRHPLRCLLGRVINPSPKVSE